VHLIEGRPERNAQTQPDEAERLGPFGKPANVAGAASFAIKIQYRGEERVTDLPLAQDMITQLAVESAFRSVPICDLISDLIMGMLQRRSGRRDRDSGLLTAASLPAPCNHLCGLALSRRACSLNPRGQALHMKPNLAPLSLAGLFLWPGCSKMQRALWIS
jgi:hypothetical protein